MVCLTACLAWQLPGISPKTSCPTNAGTASVAMAEACVRRPCRAACLAFYTRYITSVLCRSGPPLVAQCHILELCSARKGRLPNDQHRIPSLPPRRGDPSACSRMLARCLRQALAGTPAMADLVSDLPLAHAVHAMHAVSRDQEFSSPPCAGPSSGDSSAVSSCQTGCAAE
jgi:hypothetical protein